MVTQIYTLTSGGWQFQLPHKLITFGIDFQFHSSDCDCNLWFCLHLLDHWKLTTFSICLWTFVVPFSVKFMFLSSSSPCHPCHFGLCDFVMQVVTPFSLKKKYGIESLNILRFVSHFLLVWAFGVLLKEWYLLSSESVTFFFMFLFQPALIFVYEFR